jgi:hypothetical protein
MTSNVTLKRHQTSQLHPERFTRMLALWYDYVSANGVILPDGKFHDTWGDPP